MWSTFVYCFTGVCVAANLQICGFCWYPLVSDLPSPLSILGRDMAACWPSFCWRVIANTLAAAATKRNNTQLVTIRFFIWEPEY